MSARRDSLSVPFGPVRVVRGPDSGPVAQSNGLTLSADELEVITSVSGDLFVTRRVDLSTPFGALTRLSISGTASEQHPHLSRDGLELFFSSDALGTRRIFRATRSATSSDMWSTPTQISLAWAPSVLGDYTPMLSRDRRTLFFAFTSMGRASYWVERTDITSGTFGTPQPITDLNRTEDGAVYLLISETAREAYFTADHPWNTGIWRTEVCRDGPCPARDPVPCATGTLSPDGQHCYWRTTTTTDWTGMLTACGADAHPATVHSLAEDEALNALNPTGSSWLGGYDNRSLVEGLADVPECSLVLPGCRFGWVTGEGWSYSRWLAANPDNSMMNEHGLEHRAAGWNDRTRPYVQTVLCEREQWPTW
jgi:hypothetical protein